MKSKTCPACGAGMKRNGKTKAGAQRWRCRACGSSATHANDVSGRELKGFLEWLLSKERQLDMPGCGRTFRRRAERLWKIWPVPEFVDEVHRVVYADGIYLSREAVVPMARSDERVLSWHLARSETSRAYGGGSSAASRLPRWSSPTADRGSPRRRGRPGPTPGSRDASSTCSARSGATRPRGRSSRRG